jgi:hypothetical protein
MGKFVLAFCRMLVVVVGCYALVCFAVTLTPAALGQSATTGALTGTVKDTSGAVVPNAMVTVTSLATGQARTTTTSVSGTYTVGFLPPGDYQVKFQASGFTTASVPTVTVNVTETPVLDQVLTVGVQAQQVEVHGETEAVQTASSTVGTVITSSTVVATPLTSRNYTNLLGLSAGSNAGVFNASNLGRGSQDIVVNGSGTAQNNYQQDGASIDSFAGSGGVADGGGNVGIGIVNPDAIQEFKIQTSQFDASYGRNPGANVDVVTKSGTNRFHGTAFEFFRNTDLNANDFFRKLSPAPNNTRQVLNQNQFGGVFGGPVKKDKLFFFVSYQETQQKNGISPAGYSTPTLLGIPLGDRSNRAAFQAAMGAVFCPTGTSGGKTSTGGVQIACNGSNINPVALNLLELKLANGSYLIPSSSTGQNQNTTYSIPAIFKEHQAVGNFDYAIDARNTLSGRWFFSHDPITAPMGCGATSSTPTACLPGSPGTLLSANQYAVLKLTSLVSNNFVNEARVSVQITATAPVNGVPYTDTQVGIAPILPSFNILDQITVTGLFQFGQTTALNNTKYPSAWQVGDQISWSHGAHTLRAGFEFERDRVNTVLGASAGTETFATFQDFLLGLAGCSPSLTTAQCTASGTAGLTNGSFSSNISSSGLSASLTPPGGVIHHYRNPAASVFVQDDYKVRSNLTLNLGLRWEYDGMISDASGQLTNIWTSLINTVPVPGPTPATGTLAGYVVPSNYNPAINPAPTVGGIFQNNKIIPTQNSPSLRNFAPRVGFAWRPLATDRFVIRGGGGYFYDRLSQSSFNRPATQAPPYAVTLGKSGAANFASSMAQPYDPTATLGWAPRWVNVAAGTSSNLNALLLDANVDTPTTYQWGLNTQYEFLPSWVLEVGYVGSRAIHLVPQSSNDAREINQAQLASATNPVNGLTTNTVANATVRVPYLGFSPGGLGDDQTIFSGNYNALQATVRKQFSHGLQLQAAYTYARAFSTATYQIYDDQYNVPYGPNSLYRPQRLTVNYSYDLPFGTHEGLLGKLASGWNLAGVTVVQDGQPQTITDTRGGTIYGFGPGAVVTSTAEFAAGMSAANVATPGGVQARLGGATNGPGFFNKAAFSTTPVIGNGTGYGNSGVGIILGPGQFNFDATLQKITKVGGIHEDATLVFRTEFFNMFNHPQFNAPSVVDVSKSTFGQITSSSVNPRLIQFALKYVF